MQINPAPFSQGGYFLATRLASHALIKTLVFSYTGMPKCLAMAKYLTAEVIAIRL